MDIPPPSRPLPPPRGLGITGGEELRSERPSTAVSTTASESMPPPSPAPCGRTRHAESSDDQIETRSVRSSSSASRNSNRLSLTLPIPIALPTSNPSRPTPASATISSYPPTPVDTPGVLSPTDTGDFITAIAAQERRVLEIREELGRAEKELTRLKRQFHHHEAHKKRAEAKRAQPLRSMLPPSDSPTSAASSASEDDDLRRRTVELDRRRALLLGQQSAPGTPTQSKRRVFQGGHTRTLSLLSPTKTEGDFSVHEDTVVDQLKTSSKELDETFASLVQYAPITPAQLSKRASWAPRSVHQQAASGVKQIAEDFRTGLWTFVEDLRQATVGEEPVTGGGRPMRGLDGGNARSNLSITSFADDQETIRASVREARPHVANAFDNTPTPPSRFVDSLQGDAVNGGASGGGSGSSSSNGHQRRGSRIEKSPSKRFSWTPLTVDSYDDSDWSNWDSPTVKSPRWSGTTVNGDVIPTIPEKVDEKDASRNSKFPYTPSTSSPLSPSRLEELSGMMINRLTPSKLAHQASEFIKEWEKSLSPPGAIAAAQGDEKLKGT